MDKISGSKIRDARKARNLTQEQLAARIGVTMGTVSKYEREELEPGGAVLLKLADVLECDATAFRVAIDEEAQVSSAPAGEEPELTRAEALEIVEDQLGLSDVQKARLRDTLARFRPVRLTRTFLRMMADVARSNPAASAADLHNAGTAGAASADIDALGERRLSDERRDKGGGN